VSARDPFEGKVVVRRADVLWRSVPGFLALSTVDGEALQAEGPAPEIWDRLEVPVTFDELCDDLARDHDVDPRQVRADVSPFLDQLVDHGYVDLGNPNRG
jgi:hypothetical protein